MPEVKFTNVVTFSSEDPVFKAENLLNSTSKVKKWRSLTEGEPQLTVVLQMEKPVQIQTIDIGNDGSAFVEVQVGRKGSLTQDDNFHVLLGAASFLTPIESRNNQNLNRVRMFNLDKLNAEVAKQNWDQIRIVCTQPFNKHMKYGLSFIKVHSVDTSSKDVTSPKKKLGAFTLKDEDEDTLMSPVPIGGLFASRVKANSETTEKMSVAASIRSDATLSSMVLSQEESSRKRKMLMDDDGSTVKRTQSPQSSQNSGNSFYQLKKNSIDSKRQRRECDAPLPRRDVLPGEKAPKDSRSKKDEKDRDERDSAKKKIKIVERPKQKSPKPESPKPVAARSTKPFDQLLQGVVFAMSGYQNPLRGQIRDLGLEMGAKYRPDWDTTCTHLICAFPNTPKFRDVKSLGGKIVKKDWLESCNRDRKRYPWRRFCLDPNDKGLESEDEIWAADLLPSVSAPSTTTPVTSKPVSVKKEELDTDEEIEKIRREDEEKSRSFVVKTEEYDLDTDEEIEKIQKESATAKKEKSITKTEEFDMDTDEEIEKIQKESAKTRKEKEKSIAKTEEYDLDTDEEMEKIQEEKPKVKTDEIDSDEAYEADTDVDEEDETAVSDSLNGGKKRNEKRKEDKSKETEKRKEETEKRKEEKLKETASNQNETPRNVKTEESSNGKSSSFFSQKCFLMYGPFDFEERQKLTRSIRGAGGTILNFLKSGTPDYVITRENWDRNFKVASEKSQNVKFVRPEFVYECEKEQSLVDLDKFEVQKK